MTGTEPGFSVIYADDYLVVVHKDAGLLTTPAAYSSRCLVDLLEAQLDRKAFGQHRLAVVHRLDRDTAGLLVFSRSPKITPLLARQFAAHRVEREYLAFVEGKLAAAEGSFRDPVDGKRAVSHFRVLARSAAATAVVVHLETGRTNQIRRHFAAASHPLCGDTRFGATASWAFPGVALHARVLGFSHPVTKTMQRFEGEPMPWASLFLS